MGQVKQALTGHLFVVGTLDFGPNGDLLATGSWDHTTRLWDVTTGELRHFLKGHNNAVHALAFSPDGTMLATGSWDNTNARLWDVATGQVQHVLIGHAGRVENLAFSPDGMMLATGSSDGTARLWDLHYVNLSAAERLMATGQLTNLRVCRDTLKVVPILPFPPADTVWVEEVWDPQDVAEACGP